MSGPRPGIETFRRGGLTVTVTGEPGGPRTVLLDGEADLASAPAIVDALSSIVVHGELVIDLSGLAYLDSGGVRALLIGNGIVGQRKPIVLRRPQAAVRRILEVLRLGEVFDIID